MIKYVPSLTSVVIEEIRDKVSLAVEISNCRGTCAGCHTPELRKNIGEELTAEVVERYLKDNFGVNCFLLLGEGNDHEALTGLARQVKAAHPELSLALYSGRTEVEDDLKEIFDYIKTGPYIAEKGPLNKPTTNQRIFRKEEDGSWTDITSGYWR